RSPFPVPLYRTGDRARYLPDGNIEYLGRLDQQLKLRGFRIEPGEIEAVLAQHPNVRESIVIVQDEPDRRLVAYVVPAQEEISTSQGSAEPRELLGSSIHALVKELRRYLKEKLPDYMVPSAFVPLASFPLTANGKIDRRALPLPTEDTLQASDWVAPRTQTEETIAGVWRDVLGRKQISIHDNFFELGGHSLLATQAIARLSQCFTLELPLRCLFEAPTLAELAETVEEISLSAQLSAPPEDRDDREEIEL
ncbi:MAG: phosphopantetheine-binding protein, partial [Cyanophyceae cyanobacterium]